MLTCRVSWPDSHPVTTRAVARIARDLLLVRPARFGPNAETAGSNAFQQPVTGGEADPRGAALLEFDALVTALREAGANPCVVQDSTLPEKPDAVFPNNWVSFHEDGAVILYPLEAPSRRRERRIDVLEQLARAGLIRLDRLLDLSGLEQRGLFLEGTGSLVMDRRAERAYAALSSRTHAAAIAEFTRLTGIGVRSFHTDDGAGRPLYHTNVMLSIGENFAVVCAQAISDPAERGAVLRELRATGRDVIEISVAQMRDFTANILEIGTAAGRSVIAMSARARQALTPDQARRLQACADIVAVPIPTIERVGGGSVRCMIAEVFPGNGGR